MNVRHETPQREVRIDAAGSQLTGDLVVPHGASGIVIFAHGSGSSRKSSRNRAVARALQDAGMATLLLDLLTAAEEAREEAGAKLRFDVQRLAMRLVLAIDWLKRDPDTRGLRVGLFGASTGAAAALIAAANRPSSVKAVVSRGGRPDLARNSLDLVCCPTRLIVGGDDEVVLELNRWALNLLRCEKDLVVVPGATHLFEERGALEEVARLAAQWFGTHVRASERAPSGPRGSAPRPMGFRAGARSASSGEPSPDRTARPPEIVPPQHEPSTPTPHEEPRRHEPYVPSSPPPDPAMPAPEVQPFRDRIGSP
jgi:dienelactone hydrolase